MIKLDELIDVVPKLFIRRMEDMGTVLMDADALLRSNVAADVRPPFEDQALRPAFHFMGKTTPKTAADDNIIIHSKNTT